MKFKIFLVFLSVFISYNVSASNCTKQTLPNLSQNETDDDIETHTTPWSHVDNDDHSDNSESRNTVRRDLIASFTNEESTEGDSTEEASTEEASTEGESTEEASTEEEPCNSPGQDRNRANPHQSEDSGKDSSYKRVYAGEDSSGSEIYTSSSKLERALSLAEKICMARGLKIEKTNDRYLANPLNNGSASSSSSSSSSNHYREHLREHLREHIRNRNCRYDNCRDDNSRDDNSRDDNSCDDNSCDDNSCDDNSCDDNSCDDNSCDDNSRDDKNSITMPEGLEASNGSRTKEGKVQSKSTKDKLASTTSEIMHRRNSSVCLSRQMVLDPAMRAIYDEHMSAHRMALNMHYWSLDEREALEMSCQTLYDDAGSSSLREKSAPPDSDHDSTEISPTKPHEELKSEPLHSISNPDDSPDHNYITSNQDRSTKPETLDPVGTETRIDDSFNGFAVAVNALLVLLEALDIYFGSVRRVRINLSDRPQESFNVLEEISSYLGIMMHYTRQTSIPRFGSDAVRELSRVFDSVILVNEELFCHIEDFRNDKYRDDNRGLVQYLVSILRQFREEVRIVIESAQLFMEYLRDLLDTSSGQVSTL